MRQPSVSIARASREIRPPNGAARGLWWLLIAFANWTCGGGDTTPPPPPAPTTGNLSVGVSGLPAGASAQGSITGPGGFNAPLTGTQLFPGLVPGLYTVTPASVSASGTTYLASAQSSNVVAGQTASVGVAYARMEVPRLSIVGGGTGSGSGRLTSVPAGIDCTITNGVASGTCSAPFANDTTVQLVVTKGIIINWGNDCTGTAGCTVAMTQDRQVVANFAVLPIIVLSTTKPVIVATRDATTLSFDYSMKNGGGGPWAPTVSNAHPAPWVEQVSIVGDATDTKLRVVVNATGLAPYSEANTPWVTSTVVSTPGADSVLVTIKLAKTFDQPAGMAATTVRFHRFTGDSTSQTPPANLTALIDLLDARTGNRLFARILQVDPPDQNWLATPTIDLAGQLSISVKGFPTDVLQNPFGNLPSGNNFGSPIRIRLASNDGSTTCPALVIGPPDPTCQVFVYYDADPFPRLILNPWGVVLTPTSPTATAKVDKQSRSAVPLSAPSLLLNNCGNKLASQPTLAAGVVTVAADFSALASDATFRCTIPIVATYVDSSNGNKVLADTARLLVTLAKPGADVITPSKRDLNFLATAGGSPVSLDFTLDNLGPNSISLKAPTLDGFAIDGNPACPAALLPAPTLVGTSIGRGNAATVTVSINPQNQPAQVCSATLGLHATGAPDESIPVLIRLK